MVSMIGMMKKSPGPLNALKRPSLKTTALSHWFATLIEEEAREAKKKVRIPRPMPIGPATVSTMKERNPPPTRMIKKTSVAKELGFLMGGAFSVRPVYLPNHLQ